MRSGTITALHWMTAYGFVPLEHHGTKIGDEVIVPPSSRISSEPVILYRRTLRLLDSLGWPTDLLMTVKSVNLLGLYRCQLGMLGELLGC